VGPVAALRASSARSAGGCEHCAGPSRKRRAIGPRERLPTSSAPQTPLVTKSLERPPHAQASLAAPACPYLPLPVPQLVDAIGFCAAIARARLCQALSNSAPRAALPMPAHTARFPTRRLFPPTQHPHSWNMSCHLGDNFVHSVTDCTVQCVSRPARSDSVNFPAARYPRDRNSSRRDLVSLTAAGPWRDRNSSRRCPVN
jgi:hypothetical protein